MTRLEFPYDERKVRALKAGEAVSIHGLIHTGRDKFHKWFADGKPVGVDFRTLEVAGQAGTHSQKFHASHSASPTGGRYTPPSAGRAVNFFMARRIASR